MQNGCSHRRVDVNVDFPQSWLLIADISCTYGRIHVSGRMVGRHIYNIAAVLAQKSTSEKWSNIDHDGSTHELTWQDRRCADI